MNEINVELQKLLLALENLENKANKSKSNKIDEKEKSKIDLNILLSFSGNVTFKNSSNRSTAENIGLDNFVLETDCPFLSPHPFRGKPNEPKRVYDIALYLSELLGISIEEIADATSKNAMQFFNID